MLTGGACAARIRVLGAADLQSLLSPADVITEVEKAYAWKSQGLTSTFPLVFHEFVPGTADMDIKSGHLKPAGIFGMKLVSFFEPNIEKKLPPLNASIMLYDDATGQLLAVVEGAHLGGLRTGAAAALGAKHLANPDSCEFLVVGCGHQCAYQVSAMLSVFPDLERVTVFDPLTFEHAETMAASLPQAVADLCGNLSHNVRFEAAANLEAAVGRSDIITTITPARSPLIKAGWVRSGTHLNCVGADMAGKQEIDPALLKQARVFTDDTPQCIEVGELELAVAEGVLSEHDILGELGDVIVGTAQGRASREDITVFDTTGLAIQDLAAAKAALDAAEARDSGVLVDFQTTTSKEQER